MTTDAARSSVTASDADLADLARAVESALTDVRGMPIDHRKRALALTEAVEAFHKAGLAAGGTDAGGPGYRPEYQPGYYAAFLRDPDGNKVEAVWLDLSKKGTAL